MNGTIALLLATVPTSGSGAGEDPGWNRFRGPNGQGVAADTNPLPAVLDRDRNLAWATEVGPGLSSPVFAGDRLFLTGWTEPNLETLCLDRTTGEVLWRATVQPGGAERLHEINSPAASTPTTDGERVYVYFGGVGLLCYDLDGEELWRRPMDLPQNTFGSAASPILAEGLLIFVSDTNATSALEAIDPETGETVWRTDRDGFKSGWSTPILWERDGITELIVYGVWWLTAYDLADGSERWAVPGLTDEPIITPVTGDGMLFLTSYNMKSNPEVIGLPEYTQLLVDYDLDGNEELSFEEIEANESVLSRSDADGEGDHPLRIFFRFLDEDRSGGITGEEWLKLGAWLDSMKHANALMAIRPGTPESDAEIVWQHPRGVPECPSPLYYRGNVYMVKNGGMVTCLDGATGKEHYSGRLDARGPAYASPVAGDGKIYAASARGMVTVFAAGDELSVLARNDLGERIMATPALVDGKVYVRTEAALYAFDAGE